MSDSTAMIIITSLLACGGTTIALMLIHDRWLLRAFRVTRLPQILQGGRTNTPRIPFAGGLASLRVPQPFIAYPQRDGSLVLFRNDHPDCRVVLKAYVIDAERPEDDPVFRAVENFAEANDTIARVEDEYVWAETRSTAQTDGEDVCFHSVIHGTNGVLVTMSIEMVSTSVSESVMDRYVTAARRTLKSLRTNVSHRFLGEGEDSYAFAVYDSVLRVSLSLSDRDEQFINNSIETFSTLKKRYLSERFADRLDPTCVDLLIQHWYADFENDRPDANTMISATAVAIGAWCNAETKLAWGHTEVDSRPHLVLFDESTGQGLFPFQHMAEHLEEGTHFIATPVAHWAMSLAESPSETES
ncbi:MAG: hypothetical protein AAF432_07870 [Planctomycetota bacterium]